MQQRSRSSNIILITIVVMALLAVAGLNAAMSRVRNGDAHADEDAAARTEQQQAGSQAAGSAVLVNTPPDQTLGSEGAKNQVVVGWSWTPDVQDDPDKLAAVLAAVRQLGASGTARVRIVNTDAVPGVPQGVYINNKKTLDLSGGARGIISREEAVQSIGRALAGR